MSAIVKEVYDAFRSAGVPDGQATAAAKAIPLIDDLATKADIDALRAEMKVLELRMTIKLYTGLGMAVAGVKALDFLIGLNAPPAATGQVCRRGIAAPVSFRLLPLSAPGDCPPGSRSALRESA